MDYEIETRCLHLEDDEKIYDSTGSLSFPIYQTATFAHKAVGQSTGFDYSRAKNPTRERVEDIVCSLERGSRAFAFTSGMSAIACLMELFSPGDRILAEADLYVTDIRALADKLHGRGILLIVDNTFMSPYLQNPLQLGADIVVHSGTKYLGGHNDALGGFLVVKDEKIAERLEYLSMTTGAVLSPFDSWLILRGIQTLSVRMDRACSNAAKIAGSLQRCREVKKVIYPGLEDHPGYEIMKKQARGFGAMISFECESAELAKDILANLKLIKFAESLGGTQTLMTYPVTQTHADVPEEQRLKNGLNDRILRLSVGIENADDLIRDIENAIDKAVKAYE